MVGKQQRIANQTQVWAETWHLASSRSQHAQQVPASSEAQGPTHLTVLSPQGAQRPGSQRQAGPACPAAS